MSGLLRYLRDGPGEHLGGGPGVGRVPDRAPDDEKIGAIPDVALSGLVTSTGVPPSLEIDQRPLL